MRIRNVLVRRLLPLDTLDEAIAFYEHLFGEAARLTFDYPDKGLRLAQVAQVLLIGGTAASLEPFQATDMTLLVDGIEDYVTALPTIGAVVVRPLQTVPSGHNMLVRHPDGAIVEYVEHAEPNPADDVVSRSPPDRR